MGEMRNKYKILVEKSEGKRPLGRPMRRGGYIRMDLWDIRLEGMRLIDLSEERYLWRAFVNTAMNLPVP
jgi:hypothetical protein